MHAGTEALASQFLYQRRRQKRRGHLQFLAGLQTVGRLAQAGKRILASPEERPNVNALGLHGSKSGHPHRQPAVPRGGCDHERLGSRWGVGGPAMTIAWGRCPVPHPAAGRDGPRRSCRAVRGFQTTPIWRWYAAASSSESSSAGLLRRTRKNQPSPYGAELTRAGFATTAEFDSTTSPLTGA